MSDRAKAIKQRLKERATARKEAGGEWVRRGECIRCGACCDARNIDPEGYKKKAAEVLEKTGRHLSSICGNYGPLPEQRGALGCKVHETFGYSINHPGCAAFPATVEDWRLVMATCGYWFEWVEDEPRMAGKDRRRRK